MYASKIRTDHDLEVHFHKKVKIQAQVQKLLLLLEARAIRQLSLLLEKAFDFILIGG